MQLLYPMWYYKCSQVWRIEFFDLKYSKRNWGILLILMWNILKYWKGKWSVKHVLKAKIKITEYTSTVDNKWSRSKRSNGQTRLVKSHRSCFSLSSTQTCTTPGWSCSRRRGWSCFSIWLFFIIAGTFNINNFVSWDRQNVKCWLVLSQFEWFWVSIKHLEI